MVSRPWEPNTIENIKPKTVLVEVDLPPVREAEEMESAVMLKSGLTVISGMKKCRLRMTVEPEG